VIAAPKIRPAREEDCPALPAIKSDAARAFGDLRRDVAARPVSVEAMAVLAAEGTLWVAADETDAPVGFAAATMLDGTLFLADLHVRPDAARRGAGRALLRRVIDHGRWAFFPAVTLLTDRLVPWNAPFYATEGFVMLDALRLPPQLAEKLASDLARGHDPSRRTAMAKRL